MTTPDDTYWEHTARAELQLQRCNSCTAWQFPPTGRCTTCLSTDLDWQLVKGSGTVWSWVRIHKAYFGDRTDLQVPYLVAMIQLSEGVRMISALRSPDGSPELSRTPRCGEPVELMFDPEPAAGSAARLPVFRLVEEVA